MVQVRIRFLSVYKNICVSIFCVFVYLRMCVCEFGQIGFSDGGWNCGAGPYWVSLSVYTVTLLNPVKAT